MRTEEQAISLIKNSNSLRMYFSLPAFLRYDSLPDSGCLGLRKLEHSVVR